MFTIHTETLPKIHNPLTLQLNSLRALGIRFVVDNVGYQTLPIQKLREFDVDTIRISHKLMAECPYMESSWNLVKGLVELTKSVGLNCIAPCVEEAEIHHLLLDTGCQLLQGNSDRTPLTSHRNHPNVDRTQHYQQRRIYRLTKRSVAVSVN